MDAGGEKASDPHNVMLSQVACITASDGTPLMPGQMLPINVGAPVIRPYIGGGSSNPPPPAAAAGVHHMLSEEVHCTSPLIPSRSTTGVGGQSSMDIRRGGGLCLGDFNSVILVLHKLTGLERCFLGERRLLCLVTLGASQVRTSLISAPLGDSDELVLGFIIRLPLPSSLDQPLIISVQDSISKAIVAQGQLDPSTFPLKADIAISDTHLHPRGCLKYHLQLIQQPTGSASVQRMQSIPHSSTEQPQQQSSSPIISVPTSNDRVINAVPGLRMPPMRQTLSPDEFAQGQTMHYRPPPEVSHSAFQISTPMGSGIGGGSISSGGGGLPLPPPLAMPGYRIDNYSDLNLRHPAATASPSPQNQYAYPPNSARVPTRHHHHIADSTTFSEISVGGGGHNPRYLNQAYINSMNTRASIENNTTSSWDRRSHHRAASEGITVGGRRVFTQRLGVNLPASAANTGRSSGYAATYLKREDGTLQAMPHMRTSPLGVSVIERLGGQPNRSSIGSITGTSPVGLGGGSNNVRRSALPPPLTVMRGDSSSAARTTTTPAADILQISELPLHMLQTPPPSDTDLTSLLDRLIAAQAADLDSGTTVVHPFRSCSIRLDSLDAILNSGGICSLVVRQNQTDASDIVKLRARTEEEQVAIGASIPTLIIPLDFSKPNLALCITLTLGSETGQLHLPLHALLRHGRVTVTGTAELTGGLLRHRLSFSLRFLPLPVHAPVLMRPNSKYLISILPPYQPPTDPLTLNNNTTTPMALRSARSESVMSNEDQSSVAGGGGGPQQKGPWNNLIVTVRSIDDSAHPIPLDIEGVNTKDLYCKVSLGTTTALRARFVNWRQEGKKLPDFEFEHKGERVLKLSLVGTDPNSKLNLGVCRIDLHALSRTGRAFFRGRVPLAGHASFPNAPFLNLVFKFGYKPMESGDGQSIPRNPKSATSWRQALEGCTHFQFTILKITSEDLSMLRSSFCVRLSCGPVRHKTTRLELPPSGGGEVVNEFNGPITLEAQVTPELLDTLELKPFVVCIYVKSEGSQNLTNNSTSGGGSHVAYQFFRLSPSHFATPSPPPRSYTGDQEMGLAQDIKPSEPRCTMHYTMQAIAK